MNTAVEKLTSGYYVEKTPTGIKGLDEITYGGLPKARPTLITGYAGSGKTVLAMQFILNGINMYNEPGVFVSLEETSEDLRKNISSFGYDIKKMEEDGNLLFENIRVRHHAFFQSGNFDLSPLFVRIEEAIKETKAKRIAIDTFELLFDRIKDKNIFRQELNRLIEWLKERKLTAVFTYEDPLDPKKRSGVEEFVTDCVIRLNHKMEDNIYTRRMHILKYRGSKHGTNDYPFLIDENGISIMPITTVKVEKVSSEVLSSGIKALDGQIEKGGLYLGSSTLISGPSGAGKTSFSTSICVEAMKQNQRCLFYSFEESSLQLKRNMKSLGYDLQQYEDKGLLRIEATRPIIYGIELHLIEIYGSIETFKPDVVIFDPVTDLIQIGSKEEVRRMLLRIIDFLKSRMITIIFTALVNKKQSIHWDMGISSLVDNWIELNTLRKEQMFTHSISLVKLRGMAHSLRYFELVFSKEGLDIREFNEG